HGEERTVGAYYRLRDAARRGRPTGDTPPAGVETSGRPGSPSAGDAADRAAPPQVVRALALLPAAAPPIDAVRRYVAVDGDQVLAEATTAGEALRLARRRRPGTVPA